MNFNDEMNAVMDNIDAGVKDAKEKESRRHYASMIVEAVGPDAWPVDFGPGWYERQFIRKLIEAVETEDSTMLGMLLMPEARKYVRRCMEDGHDYPNDKRELWRQRGLVAD